MRSVFATFKPEAVFMAVSHSYPKDVIYNFFDDTKLVLDSANVLSCLLTEEVKHVYFCSSSEIYGGPQTSRPLKETRKVVRSATLHGTSKLMAEQLLGFRCNELSIPFTVLRIFDMYGPRIIFSPTTGVLSFITEAFLTGETSKIALVGATCSRDFIHVNDVVKATMGIVDSGFTGVVNIGTGKGHTLRGISRALRKLIPSAALPAEVSGSTSSFSSVAHTGRLAEVIGGWKPEHNVLDDLPQLVEHRKEELNLKNNTDPRKKYDMLRGALG